MYIMELPIDFEEAIKTATPETNKIFFQIHDWINTMNIETKKLENKEINKDNFKAVKLRIESNIRKMINSINFIMKKEFKFGGDESEVIKVSLRKNMLKRLGNLITRQVILLEEEGVNYEDINWPKNTVSTLKQLLISGVLVSAAVISIITGIVTSLILFKKNI